MYQRNERRPLFLKKKKGDQNCIPGDLFISEGRQKATYKKTSLGALKVTTIPNKRSPDHGCDIRLVERDCPLPPDINAEGH